MDALKRDYTEQLVKLKDVLDKRYMTDLSQAVASGERDQPHWLQIP